MKMKHKIVAVFLVVSIFLWGGNIHALSAAAQTSLPMTAATIKIDNPDTRLSIEAFTGDKVIFYTNPESGKVIYYSYSIPGRKVEKIGQIVNAHASSGDSVLTDENQLYYVQTFSGENARASIINVNAQEGKIQEKLILNTDYMARMEPIDNESFLYISGNYFPDDIEGLGYGNTYVKIYDVEKNTTKIIQQDTYNPEASDGTTIDAVSYFDGHVYVLYAKDKRFYMNKWDREGNLIKNYQLSWLDGDIVNDITDPEYLSMPVEFVVRGQYAFISFANGRSIVFDYESQKIVLLYENEDRRMMSTRQADTGDYILRGRDETDAIYALYFTAKGLQKLDNPELCVDTEIHSAKGGLYLIEQHREINAKQTILKLYKNLKLNPVASGS
jgi:hypothetical protein